MIVADRASERRRLHHARMADEAMPLAAFYRQRNALLPMLPAGPASCPDGCRYCSHSWPGHTCSSPWCCWPFGGVA
jgi:hypothetical protein